MNDKKDCFITFEGIDGSGKSTQASLLSKFLSENGIGSVLVRDPGGTPTAESIRKLILDNHHRSTLMSELILYTAARYSLLTEVIEPALKSGKVVISDRYFDSTEVYQGYRAIQEGSVPQSLIRKTMNDTNHGIIPNFTFFLDIPPELAIFRLGKRKSNDLLDDQLLSYLGYLRYRYTDLASRQPTRIYTIKSNCDQEIIHKNIVSILNSSKSFNHELYKEGRL